MKRLVRFNRPNAAAAMVAPEHVQLVEPTLDGTGTRIWLLGWSVPVIVDHNPNDVWTMLWHSEILADREPVSDQRKAPVEN